MEIYILRHGMAEEAQGGMKDADRALTPEGAKKLLVEAGYPDGFGITLHGPNNRYVNDDQIVQAVAQMLTRVGIVTKVETLPFSVYVSRANKVEFSAALSTSFDAPRRTSAATCAVSRARR